MTFEKIFQNSDFSFITWAPLGWRLRYFVNLSSSIFFFQQLDHNNKAKLNVSKPRNDAIPYPDGQALFHLPGQNPGEQKMDPDTANTLKMHCVYSLAVLLWILGEQRFIRPDYAKTNNVSDVYDAIAQGKDSTFLERRVEQKSKQSRGGLQALEMVLSTFNAQKQKFLLLDWLDNLNLKVTGLLSSYETMETEL